MKSTDEVGITFANLLVASGVYNGVVNASFASYQFTPTPDGKIDPDPVVTARLRMDIVCAKQLRDRLIEILDMVDKTQAATTGLVPNGHDRATDEVLN